MNKWICLKNKEQLYIDIVLVHFDVPLLFICKDEIGKKYLVECIDEEKEMYILSPIDDDTILNLINKEITMRDSIKQGKNHRVIKVEYNFKSKSFEEKDITSDELHNDELPDEGAYLEYLSSDVRDYKKRLKRKKIMPIKYQYEIVLKSPFLKKNNNYDAFSYQNRLKTKTIFDNVFSLERSESFDFA